MNTLTLPTMPENTRALVDALRSGEYTQARGTLAKDDDSMCCLGVGCDVLAKRGQLPKSVKWTKRSKRAFGRFVLSANHKLKTTRGTPEYTQSQVPFDIVLERMGFTVQQRITLTNANDNSRYRFDQIADLIEGWFAPRRVIHVEPSWGSGGSRWFVGRPRVDGTDPCDGPVTHACKSLGEALGWAHLHYPTYTVEQTSVDPATKRAA